MTVGKRADLITGLGLVVLAGCIYHEAAAMPALKRGLGPGGYPIFAAVGLGILGIILAVQTFIKSDNDKKPLFTITAGAAARAALFTVMAVAYAQAIPTLGFILASFLFLVLATYFFGYRRHLLALAFSILLPAAVFAVFRYGFLVLIPTGTLF